MLLMPVSSSKPSPATSSCRPLSFCPQQVLDPGGSPAHIKGLIPKALDSSLSGVLTRGRGSKATGGESCSAFLHEAENEISRIPQPGLFLMGKHHFCATSLMIRSLNPREPQFRLGCRERVPSSNCAFQFTLGLEGRKGML